MTDSKMRLAACIKIRNKEVMFNKVAQEITGSYREAKVANVLSKINPTSFRNTGLNTLKGIGTQGGIVGGLHYFAPGVTEATERAMRGISTIADKASLAKNLSYNTAGSMGRVVSQIASSGGREANRQRLIQDYLRKGSISVDDFANNVTRYVPIHGHGNYYAKLEADLGKDVMNRYRGAFVL